jgi:tetratricopeptide (TPR) repeat protein
VIKPVAGFPGSKKPSSNSNLVSDIGIQKAKPTKGGSRDTSTASGSSNKDDASSGLILEDSFEKFYNKDLDLEEDQVPVVIYELNESALNFISQEQYEKALILLQKAQTMLDQIQSHKIDHDKFIFMLTLHNMAMCYQKLGILEECSICLEACLEHLESDYMQNYFNNPEQPSLRLKMLKYKCKTHMQICALLSQIHKHKEAIFHSDSAIKISHYLINETKSQCHFYLNQLTKKEGHLKNNISIINDKRFSLLEKTSIKMLPILIEIQKKMAIEDYRKPTDGGNYITGPYKLAKGGRGAI